MVLTQEDMFFILGKKGSEGIHLMIMLLPLWLCFSESRVVRLSNRNDRNLYQFLFCNFILLVCFYPGVTLLFSEPPDARKPTVRWRLHVFKAGEVLKVNISTSAYLLVGLINSSPCIVNFNLFSLLFSFTIHFSCFVLESCMFLMSSFAQNCMRTCLFY